MKLRKNIIKFLVALVVGCVGAIAPTATTYAEGDNSEETPATWLQVSPTSKQATFMSGDVLEGDEYEVEVKNIGTEAFQYKVYTSPYAVSGEDYKLDFSQETTYTQIARWITFENDQGEYVKEVTYTIKPGESKKIPYRITVPEDVPGGAQYAVIWAQTLGGGESGGVQTVSRAGMVIYGRSIGDTMTTGEISDYDYMKFTFGGPLTAKATIKNTGNTDFDAYYTYTARTIFGKVLKEDKGVIKTFPDTEYHADINWENTPFMGIFTVTWSVVAATANEEHTSVVMIIPVFMIVLLILLLTVIIIWIIIIIRKRKQRKSRVLV